MISEMQNGMVLLKEARINVTKGGIIIPETAKTSDPVGEVVMVGADVTFVKVGDFAIIRRHSGDPIEHEDVIYIIVDVVNVLAKVVISSIN